MTKGHRRDSVQCPACNEWGCPATNGSYAAEDGMHRYRKCSACGTSFMTWEAYGTRGEQLVRIFGTGEHRGRPRKPTLEKAEVVTKESPRSKIKVRGNPSSATCIERAG